MQKASYSLRELVQAIAPDADADRRKLLTRRIRYWTNEGALWTEGQKGTGTGRERRYGPTAPYIAAVNDELTKYGFPIRQILTVAQYNGQISQHFGTPAGPLIHFKKRAERELVLWNQAIRGEKQVLLALVPDDEMPPVAARGVGLAIGEAKDFEARGTGDTSILLIDLTGLFAGVNHDL